MSRAFFFNLVVPNINLRRRNEVKKEVISVLCLIVFVFNLLACSVSGPSDENIVKALDDSGLLKSDNFSVTAPIVILEKGKKEKDGSWPVEVKLTLTMIKSGQSKTIETTPTFRIYTSKDSTGKTIWTAKLGA